MRYKINMNRIKTLLEGKVAIETLPAIVPSSEKIMEGPKRIFLEKGELAEIYNSQDAIKHIVYLEFIVGKARGGHYHTRQEYFYIIRGEMELTAADAETGATEKVVIKEGDLISMPPKIAHIIKAIKPGHAIEFSKDCFKPEDTTKYAFPLDI